MAVLERLNILEKLYAKDSGDIDPGNLAALLGVNKRELADALKLDPSAVSRTNIDPANKTVKKWLVIFNLFIDLAQQEDAKLNNEQIQVKMSRWLKLPLSQLGNLSPLDAMMKGKARNVIHLLEQLNS
jgi:DNA-binding MarR family transcriptional regulator